MGCCNSNIQKNYLKIVKSNFKLYNIIYIKQINNTDIEEETVFEQVKIKEDTQKFIDILNKIFNKINKLSKENISEFHNNIKNILSEFPNKDEKNEILQIAKGFDLKSIKEYIKIFEYIYHNLNEIKNEIIIYFIQSINFLLKEINILDELEINIFINKIKEIFGQNNNLNGTNNMNNINIEREIILPNNININSENKSQDRNTINSFNSDISHYSERTQNEIRQKQQEIYELQNFIEKNHINEKNIKLTKLIFKFENKELPIKMYIDKRDKFTKVIDYVFQEYPEIEEKGIRKFTINGKTIKSNDYIKDIDLENDVINIEF